MAAGSSGFSSGARRQVQQILAKPPYRHAPSHSPRPLAGVLHALGRALDAVLGRPARWLYAHVLRHVGHGFRVALGGWWEVVAAVLAIAVGVAAGVVLARRRARVAQPERAHGAPSHVAEDPDEIDRRAGAAERAGEHEAAVRLHYRAGLIRLARAGVVADAGTRTDRQLSTLLDSRTFDGLARRHEAIVYAGERATSEDASAASEQWPRLLLEVGGRRR